MKKKIAIIAIVLIVIAGIAGIAALVIVSRPKTVKVHCYKVCGIDWGIYEDVPAYWNKEAQQWLWVWDDSPVPERLLFQTPNLNVYGGLWCVEGFTPWDYYYGDGIPHIGQWIVNGRGSLYYSNINGEKCKIEEIYEY